MNVVLVLLSSTAVITARFDYNYQGNSGNNYNSYSNLNSNNHIPNGGYPVYDDIIVANYPDFLDNVSPQLALEFVQIGMNISKPISQVESEQQEWAIKNNLENEYNNYTASYEEGRAAFFDDVKKLSISLQQFFDKSRNITDNKDHSYQEMLGATQSLFDSYKKKERRFIDRILRTYKGNRYFPAFSSCSGRNSHGNGKYLDGNGAHLQNDVYPWNNGNYRNSNENSYIGQSNKRTYPYGNRFPKHPKFPNGRRNINGGYSGYAGSTWADRQGGSGYPFNPKRPGLKTGTGVRQSNGYKFEGNQKRGKTLNSGWPRHSYDYQAGPDLE